MFYDQEIMLRKALRYPPFCDIIMLGISGINKEKVEKLSYKIFKIIKNEINNQKENKEVEEQAKLILYKPMAAPIDRIKNKYRWRIIIKCIYDEKMQKLIENTMVQVNKDTHNSKDETKVSIDLNPKNML